MARDLSRNALFDICFDFQNMERHDFEVDNLEFSPFLFETKTATYDLLLTLQENKKTGVIEGYIEYSVGLFKRETIQRIIENYKSMLSRVIKLQDAPLDTIDIVSNSEKQVIEAFDSISLPASDICLVQKLFENNASLFPDKIGLIVAGGQTFSYGDLNEKANRLATQLVKSGLQLGQVVAVVTARDETLIISILGILKAGGAYLLIDIELRRKERRICWLKLRLLSW